MFLFSCSVINPIKFNLWNKISTDNSSGGDGTLVALFQILKDDAVKVLLSMCQQIWKTQQWPWDWKRSVFIPIRKKHNAKECSNYRTIALISHASKVMLKILQARLQQYVNHELPDVQVGFRKGRGTDWCWSWNSNTSASWWEELTHWKRPWCWEWLKVRGEKDDRGWDGWMASQTQWTWVWVNSGSW